MLDEMKKACKAPFNAERKFFYFFSTRLVALLQNSTVTPDHLSFLSLIVVLFFCGITASVTEINFMLSLILAALLIVSNILDAADGQLARVKKEFSAYGGLMDALFDLIKQFLIIFSFSVYFFRTGKSPYYILIAFAAFFLIQFKYLYRHIAASNLDKLIQGHSLKKRSALLNFVQRADSVILKTNLGLLTVGEFYIIIALGVLTRLIPLGLIVLAVYALFIIVYELSRSISGAALLNYYTLQDKKVIIFGAGKAGVNLKGILEKAGITPLYFSDNDENKWGNEINGLIVIPPDDLKDKGIPVIIASEWYREINKQLEGRGIEKIIPSV